MRDLLCTTKYLYNYFISQGFVYFIQLEYYSVDMFSTSESTRYKQAKYKNKKIWNIFISLPKHPAKHIFPEI